ncbi:seryl-tRNA synthetase [Wallemia mellicola CBS 633.66]|uniref:serine--tRNA ligase n=2 Tax=Wallemia mellicola TaxID=1708541 RepID=I4YGT6_WALMC|nr:seryl-tRNA synthetase [Wallemia mellicola CBS 633.66]TIC11810.1 seryl-tRNA synthetase [Wallemia mellicola]EIM23178.1 seryl-tRNA synthetase [Wallemia mellicola CBS 633.66]TIC20968.1 seryl-tRNA synthetase [Wallemia mellicola]TIC29869.1 seryl-tRNA synthetase [Wallemia mellicola]TIC52652.1 seryl-tRNA synthetase [Wallemia mellicola]|eukprot:XP_006956572.1 seryl-tRNA synthetase [Wallemia mellicola CBS 633.66]
MKPRLNFKGVKNEIEYFKKNNINRNIKLDLNSFLSIYNKSTTLENELNKTKNEQTKQQTKELKLVIKELEKNLKFAKDELFDLTSQIPNKSHPKSPINNEPNEILSGGPTATPSTPLRDHLNIANRLNAIENASDISGNGFTILKDELAVLEHALIQFSLNIAVENGYKLITIPDIVKLDIANRCGFLPRDNSSNQTYSITNSSDNPLCLAGTAEIPLAGLHYNQLLNQSSLPLKYVACGHAFRAEAGARGRDTRGLYRLHQFTKVELFSLTDEKSSDSMLEEIINVQKQVVEALNLPYRILDMPTQELGASAYRKYDIEAWMPGRGEWGEISSASNCIDYQSRRLLIRYKDTQSGGNIFAHTLNGTAAAIPRLILALIENGAESDEDANIRLALPKALQKYWIGKEDRIRWQ